MARLFDTIRIICGIIVLAGGLMGLGFFGWEPPVAGPDARAFQIAMHDAGYFLPIMTAVFLTAGISFIIDRYTALLAVVMFPISFNILLFHIILGVGQLPAAIALFLINCFMLWYRRKAFGPLLRPKP